MTDANQSKAALERAARAKHSAGRAAGYCWMEKPADYLHCTLSMDHEGPHYHAYERVEWAK